MAMSNVINFFGSHYGQGFSGSAGRLSASSRFQEPPSNIAAALMSGEHSVTSASSSHPTKSYVSESIGCI